MMDNADQTTNALARSVGTGYICATAAATSTARSTV